MSEPTTKAGRALLAKHPQGRSWPIIRNDPRTRADGYRYFCRRCGGDNYPCGSARLIAAIEAEAREAERERIAALVEGMPGLFVGVIGVVAVDAPAPWVNGPIILAAIRSES